MLAPVLDGRAEVVYGNRTFGAHSSYSFWYVMGNQAVTTAANMLFNCYLGDLETGLKLMPVALYRSLDVRSRGFGMEAEVTGKLLRRQIRPYEVPIRYQARVARTARRSPGGTAWSRCGSSPGNAPADRPANRSGDAELVALRVGHGDPGVRTLPAFVQPRRAPVDQPGDLGAHVAVDPEVEVDPVLRGLPLGYQLEQDPAAPAGSTSSGWWIAGPRARPAHRCGSGCRPRWPDPRRSCGG